MLPKAAIVPAALGGPIFFEVVAMTLFTTEEEDPPPALAGADGRRQTVTGRAADGYPTESRQGPNPVWRLSLAVSEEPQVGLELT